MRNVFIAAADVAPAAAAARTHHVARHRSRTALMAVATLHTHPRPHRDRPTHIRMQQNSATVATTIRHHPNRRAL